MDENEFNRWVDALEINNVNYREIELKEETMKGGNGILRRAREVWMNGIEVILKRNHINYDIREEVVLLGMLKKQPFAARLFGITTDEEGNLWMIMDYAENENLCKNLSKVQLSTFDRVELAAGIAKGLKGIHQKGILHRDLHSGNILIDKNGTPMITDFGLSRQLNKIQQSNLDVAGVMPYIAPEVLIGQPYTALADVYSLGVIMWEIFANRRPFRNRYPHDNNFKNEIIGGLREERVPNTPNTYIQLYESCWSDLRPTTIEVIWQLDALGRNSLDRYQASVTPIASESQKINTSSHSVRHSTTVEMNPIYPLSTLDKIDERRKAWNPCGCTPPPLDIFRSALMGDIDALQWFLNQDEQYVHRQDVFLHTPLHYAAFALEPYNVLDFLLQRGANAIATNVSGETSAKFVLIAPHEPETTVQCLWLLRRYGAQLAWEDIENQSSLQYGTHPLHALQQRFAGNPKKTVRRDGVAMHWGILQPRFTPQGMDGDELVYACRKAIHVLAYGPPDIFHSVNQMAYFTSTLFWAIACTGNVDITTLQSLIKQGVDINVKDASGRTALHFVAGNSADVKVMQWLLDHGANIDAMNHAKWTALHFVAAYSCNIEAMRLLVENRADVNARTEDKWTALHLIARNHGTIETMRLLVENRADVNARTNGGSTALHCFARHYGNIEAMRLLVENGADVNVRDNKGWMALHHIARHNDEKFEEMLFMMREMNLDVNTPTNFGFTVMHLLTCHGCHVNSMRFLVKERGANVNTKGQTPIHVFSQHHQSVDEMRSLLNIGPDIDTADFDEWTLLHTVALFNGKILDIVQFLVEECRMNVNVADKDGCMALHLFARVDCNVEVMRILLDNGADVNARVVVKMKDGDIDYWTPLRIVKQYHDDNVEVKQLLCEYGAIPK